MFCAILTVGWYAVESKVNALDKKKLVLETAMRDKKYFKVDDAQVALGGIKKTTLYWDLFQMVERGMIVRVGKGKYSLRKPEDSAGALPRMSKLALKIRQLLQDSGLSYYISGLDVLMKYMHHVPERFPVLLFVDGHNKEEVGFILRKNGVLSMTADAGSQMDMVTQLGVYHDTVILRETGNFDYAPDGVAIGEKAFVDLYMEVSRRRFPLALQELARIFETMERLGVIDEKVLIKVAYSRSLHHDMRFLVESKRIHEDAFKLVRMIRGQNANE